MNIELLSPAGSLSALKVAVNAGADAVYIGGKNFSARKSAKNFSLEDIKLAVEYAHKYHRKVYLAINTLVYNDEVLELIEYLYEVYNLGVDAIIVQDFALYQIVKNALPDMEVHASTQMSIMNTSGALLLKNLGFQRVVLARETNLNDMEFIKRNAKIECEVFIHGALCIAYSGLCYMSSLIGGRSGNRGDCAQPCRQKYRLLDETNKPLLELPLHLLSPKDLSLSEILPAILESKIDSLKIEGRMKQDEYIYLVTSAYRELINNYNNKCYNNKRESLIKRLEQMYSRSGFTTGFSISNPYNTMMSYKIPKKNGVSLGEILEDTATSIKVLLSEDIECGDGIVCYDEDYNIISSGFIEKISSLKNKVIMEAKKNTSVLIYLNKRLNKKKIVQAFLTYDKSLSKEIKEKSLIKPAEKKIGIKLYCTAKLNNPLTLVGITEQNEICEVKSEYTIQRAENKITCMADILDKLNRLGNSSFYLEDSVIDLDENVFIPLSVINQLRQKLLVHLEGTESKKIVKETYLNNVYDYLDSIPPSVNLNQPPKLIVRTSSIEDALLFIDLDVSKIILNLSFLDRCDDNHSNLIRLYEACKNNNIELSYTASPVLNNSEIIDLEKQLFALKEMDMLKSFYVSNIGQILLCNKLGIEKLCGTEHLNVTNDLSLDFYMKEGFNEMILSQELSFERLKNLSMIGNLPLGLVIHSQSPAMFLRYNLIESIKRENDLNLEDINHYKIVNNHNDTYKIVLDKYQMTTLVHQKVIHVLDKFEHLKTLGIDGFIIDLQYDLLNKRKASEIIEIYANLIDDKLTVNEAYIKLSKIYNNNLINSFYLQ